jgi:hypothetical protein
VTLLVPLRVAVDQAIDTGSAEGSSCDALAFSTSPGTSDIAASERFDGTGNDGGFSGLLPLL